MVSYMCVMAARLSTPCAVCMNDLHRVVTTKPRTKSMEIRSFQLSSKYLRIKTTTAATEKERLGKFCVCMQNEIFMAWRVFFRKRFSVHRPRQALAQAHSSQRCYSWWQKRYKAMLGNKSMWSSVCHGWSKRIWMEADKSKQENFYFVLNRNKAFFRRSQRLFWVANAIAEKVYLRSD